MVKCQMFILWLKLTPNNCEMTPVKAPISAPMSEPPSPYKCVCGRFELTISTKKPKFSSTYSTQTGYDAH